MRHNSNNRGFCCLCRKKKKRNLRWVIRESKVREHPLFGSIVKIAAKLKGIASTERAYVCSSESIIENNDERWKYSRALEGYIKATIRWNEVQTPITFRHASGRWASSAIETADREIWKACAYPNHLSCLCVLQGEKWNSSGAGACQQSDDDEGRLNGGEEHHQKEPCISDEHR